MYETRIGWSSGAGGATDRGAGAKGGKTDRSAVYPVSGSRTDAAGRDGHMEAIAALLRSLQQL